MGKNKRYHVIGKVNNDMKGATKMDEKDFEGQDNQDQNEEKAGAEKKHPIKDWCSKHKTGLKMAGIGLLTFTVGALAGAATKKDNSSGNGHTEDDLDDCIDLIEVDDSDVIDLNTTDAGTDSTNVTE